MEHFPVSWDAPSLSCKPTSTFPSHKHIPGKRQEVWRTPLSGVVGHLHWLTPSPPQCYHANPESILVAHYVVSRVGIWGREKLSNLPIIAQVESTEINPIKLHGFTTFLYAAPYFSFILFYAINTIIEPVVPILAREEYQMMFQLAGAAH